MVRATREFFYHARFDPALPRTTAPEYEKLVRRVIQRNSRCPSRDEEQIVVPGFANLHEFSAAFPNVLKDQCGTAWSSYFQRGNWRMVLPITRRAEAKTAERLVEELHAGQLPIVHVYRFPDTTLNHGILIYGQSARDHEVLFQVYDPNNPGRPAELRYDQDARTFLFERNQYFPGGPVKVYEVYRGLAF
jgi:hypothetical protein